LIRNVKKLLLNPYLQSIPMILEKAARILEQPVCDNCLGRQFGQLLSGFDNKERGSMLRTMVAMSIDKEEKPTLNPSNFSDYNFHSLDMPTSKKMKCSVCNDLFQDLGKWAKKIKKAKKQEFDTFLMGTKLPFSLIEKEETLWENVGIDFCEPLKAEINRELGKLVEKELKIKFAKHPHVNIICNFATGKVDIEINPIFIYGEYQKLVRGIPQTRWPSGKYKTSVEQIIAKPFMKQTKGKEHKLHGMGREDIDARCLGWRPFVLEILEPNRRSLNLKVKLPSKINVRKLRPSSIQEVRRIKEFRAEKSYRALITCDGKIKKSDLKKLQKIKNVKQKTPQRVIHRRADRYRYRKVKKIKTKFINSKRFVLEVRGEAGLYIKELINGDQGRTEPNITNILGVQCNCKELDVTAIHL